MGGKKVREKGREKGRDNGEESWKRGRVRKKGFDQEGQENLWEKWLYDGLHEMGWPTNEVHQEITSTDIQIFDLKPLYCIPVPFILTLASRGC